MQRGIGAEVAFHFNVADRHDHALRLLRKAVKSGARCQVLAPEGDLVALDHGLWVRFTDEFLAHSVETDPRSVRDRSPLHLGSGAPEGVSVRVVLDGGDPAALVTGAQRVIEIVGREEKDRERARHRWRAYRQLGIEPLRHDFATRQAVSTDGTLE